MPHDCAATTCDADTAAAAAVGADVAADAEMLRIVELMRRCRGCDGGGTDANITDGLQPAMLMSPLLVLMFLCVQ